MSIQIEAAFTEAQKTMSLLLCDARFKHGAQLPFAYSRVTCILQDLHSISSMPSSIALVLCLPIAPHLPYTLRALDWMIDGFS